MLAIILGSSGSTASQVPSAGTVRLQPSSVAELPTRNVSAKLKEYRGRHAVQVIGTAGDDVVDKLLMLRGPVGNGIIEVDAAGHPELGQGADARSYFGIAFRANADFSRFEAIYIRPENARSEDQLRRNRTTQYIAFPDRSWQKLRSESPGRYESYVDLEPGSWTRLRIEISGRRAKLYVNDADQPALVVTDLEPSTGTGVAFWIGNRTVAYFSPVS